MRKRTYIAGLATLALLLAAGAGAYDLVPSRAGKAVTLVRGNDEKDYFSLAKNGLNIPLQGPGELSGWVKMAMDPGQESGKGRLELSGVPGIPKTLRFDFDASDKDSFKDGSNKVISGGERIGFSIPAGRHNLKIKGDRDLMLILYYDGPEQPLSERRLRTLDREKKSPWSLSRSFTLSLEYDDNIVHYSDDLVDEFIDGAFWAWYQMEAGDAEIEWDKYRLRTVDDLIVTPSFELDARREYFSFGDTRVRGRITYSRYLFNPIKDVKSLKLYFRQYLPGRSQSFEFSYQWTPEKYIRQLNDRVPYAPGDDPRPWVGFRFASNDFTYSYRHRLHDDVFLLVNLEDVHRFYNQPFLEQDLVENEIVGYLYYDLAKRWRLTAVYGTARGWTRRHDTAEENPLFSDDNDNSYTQDRYRADLRWRPKDFPLGIEELEFRFQRRIQYYTSPKSLWDDPFHVGRKDVYDTYRLSLARDLPWDIGASFSVDFTSRKLYSPYTGDISEGMDYDNLRIWMDLTYNW